MQEQHIAYKAENPHKICEKQIYYIPKASTTTIILIYNINHNSGIRKYNTISLIFQGNKAVVKT